MRFGNEKNVDVREELLRKLLAVRANNQEFALQDSSLKFLFFSELHSLHKDKIDGTDDEQECQDVVPMKVLTLEEDVGHNGKNGQRNALLNYFQLHKGERTTVADEAHAVGRYLTTILEEGDGPREDDDTYERPMAGGAVLL